MFSLLKVRLSRIVAISLISTKVTGTYYLAKVFIDLNLDINTFAERMVSRFVFLIT